MLFVLDTHICTVYYLSIYIICLYFSAIIYIYIQNIFTGLICSTICSYIITNIHSIFTHL